MIDEPIITNHQNNLLLVEVSANGQDNKFHHIIGWGDLQFNRVPITASIEPQSAFQRSGGWGIHPDGGFLLYDRNTEFYYNPLTGDRYSEFELAEMKKEAPSQLQNGAL